MPAPLERLLSKTIHLPWLALGGAGMLAVWALAQLGVRSIPMYVIAGFGMWLGFHESGVHATLAGVILGLMTPHRSWVGGDALREAIARAGAFLHGEREDPQRLAVLGELGLAAREAASPLERLEHALHPWQSFAIVPLFALANAGVAVKLEAFADPVALAVAAGLVAGKPVGILAASWLSSKWPHRAPDDKVLIRTFAGGARDPEAFHLPDDSLIARSLDVLTPLLGISGRPILTRVYRWERASAQHEVGHLDRLRAIDPSARSGAALGLKATITVAYNPFALTGERADTLALALTILETRFGIAPFASLRQPLAASSRERRDEAIAPVADAGGLAKTLLSWVADPPTYAEMDRALRRHAKTG